MKVERIVICFLPYLFALIGYLLALEKWYWTASIMLAFAIIFAFMAWSIVVTFFKNREDGRSRD